MQGFDYNRVIIALACLGVAQISLEETMAYVKDRRTFGRTLATYEGVSFPIAEAATHIDACRLLSYRALWLADRGEPYTKESAMVKWWGPKLSVETIHQCLLLHGHYGYTDELPFEQRLRDVIGPRDRGRNRGDHEDRRRPRDDGPREPALLGRDRRRCRKEKGPQGISLGPWCC